MQLNSYICVFLKPILSLKHRFLILICGC